MIWRERERESYVILLFRIEKQYVESHKRQTRWVKLDILTAGSRFMCFICDVFMLAWFSSEHWSSFLYVHQPHAGTIWLQRSSGGWKSLNAYLIRCLRRGLALKQISGVPMFFLLETRLLDATGSFWFLFSSTFPSWGCSLDVVFCLSIMPLCKVLAPSQMILMISWLLGKNVDLLTLSFRFFTGLSGYWLTPTLWSHCMRSATKFVQSNIFLFTCQVLPTILKNPRIKILLVWSKFLAWSLHLTMLLHWLLC